MEYTQTIDPYKFWTYKRVIVETEWGEEFYYEMKTDSGAYTVKIEKLVGIEGTLSLYGWFVWITHREDSADVKVYTNFRSAWSSGFGTLKEAKRFGTNWVHEAIREVK